MMFYGCIGNSRGAITLLVAMLVLLVISVMLALAFTVSNANLKAVGNLEMRSAAIAAAEKEIARIASGHPGTADFHRAVRSEVDINLDGNTDFQVDLAPPVCIRATLARGGAANSVTLDHMPSDAVWNTIWEIRAVASGVHNRARATVTQALRYFLTAAQKNSVCI